MQPINHGWFYTTFPQRNGALLPATEIFSMRTLPPLPQLAQGMLRVKLSLVAVAPMAKTYLELPGNNTGAEELGLQRTAIGSPVPSEYIADVVETTSPAYSMGDRI